MLQSVFQQKFDIVYLIKCLRLYPPLFCLGKVRFLSFSGVIRIHLKECFCQYFNLFALFTQTNCDGGNVSCYKAIEDTYSNYHDERYAFHCFVYRLFEVSYI